MDNDETNSTDTSASVDSLDGIASLLAGEDVTDTETTDDSSNDDESKNESTNEVDESNEETDDQDEELVADSSQTDDDEEVTWDGVLGVESEKIVLDDDGNFSGINVKVDGETSTVKLNDLIFGYQSNKHNTNKSKAISEDIKSFEQVRDATVSEYSNKLESLGKLTEYLNTNLTREFNDIDWARLRVEAPAEYAAARQDFQIRQSEIQSVYQAIESDRKTESDKLATSNKDKSDKYLGEQVELIISNNPEWNTKDKFDKAFSDMGDFVFENYGFSKGEFANVQDARLIELVKDARKYRQGLKISDKKVLKDLPKYQKKGGGAKRTVSKLDKLTRAAKKAKGDNKRNLQATAVAELLTGG